jgi:hypothetical protein
MKKLLLQTMLVIFFPCISFSQEQEFKGKPVVELFSDLHYNIRRDTVNTTGFAVSRAYFGYDFTLNQKFATCIIIDIGNPADLATGSKSRRYAYFREASARYTGEKLTVTAGMTGTRIYQFQQKFWGKRYIANSFQALNGYGFVADLGIVADYKFNDIVSGDVSLTNGDGYFTPQLNNSLKASIGITLTPASWFSARFYSDLMKKDGIFQNTLIGFAGFRTEIIYFGGEVSFKSNIDLTEGHNAWGISSTAGAKITEKNEIFVRVDYSTSTIVTGDTDVWNYERDGTFFIGGIQHNFNKYVQAALDYQSFFPVDDTRTVTDFIYLNLHVKF